MSNAITCHGDVSQGGIFNFDQPGWRDPQPNEEPYGYPFRTCGYCGSIHPEDLLGFLGQGAQLESSDWKYGWPHKFYVRGIANPMAGKIVEVGSQQGGDINEATPGSKWKSTCPHKDCQERTRDHGYWYVPNMSSAPAHTHAKFYNVHLKDCSQDMFDKLATIFVHHTGIYFQRDGDAVKYRKV